MTKIMASSSISSTKSKAPSFYIGHITDRSTTILALSYFMCAIIPFLWTLKFSAETNILVFFGLPLITLIFLLALVFGFCLISEDWFADRSWNALSEDAQSKLILEHDEESKRRAYANEHQPKEWIWYGEPDRLGRVD